MKFSIDVEFSTPTTLVLSSPTLDLTEPVQISAAIAEAMARLREKIDEKVNGLIVAGVPVPHDMNNRGDQLVQWPSPDVGEAAEAHNERLFAPVDRADELPPPDPQPEAQPGEGEATE